ncbi:hypothetical protein WMY93_005500 [Mugilogobius chulae]|uniref:PHD-type domain-containing protein n=1 Tax=Mugilogobius chulae TaxID=88201 RepID=A0AAW0PH85_9GOBI
MMNAVKEPPSCTTMGRACERNLEAKLERREFACFPELLSESESKLFPENDLLRRLRLVTQDAEKCSTVAQQLLNGKRQTRYCCGSGKSRSQLTVEELRSFVRQLYNLSCSLPQAPKLKDLLNRIEDFQQHSEKVLSDEVPSVSEIQGLLDVSFDFDVDLPELPRLRVRLEQARWLEAVQQESGQPKTLSLETMRRLIDQGVGLGPHPSVEKAMAHLQELLTVSEHWEEKAISLLKARPPHSIETLSGAAEKASVIRAYLPNCLLLKDTIRKAREWLQEAEELQASEGVPLAESLSDMVLRGQAIQVHLEPLDKLETLMSEIQEWKEEAASAFRLKDSSLSLLELATLEELRLREMESFFNLRASNESKLLPTTDCMDLRVCMCQKPPMGAMLQCELCRDAFHCACVPELDDRTQPWLCTRCRRSVRPPLAKIFSLLASLERLGVRLPEGDALNYVVERTVDWQQRAQQVLCAILKLEERAGTPPTLTRWAPGNTEEPKNTQAPCLTPEWNRISHTQTVFYTEQKCIPLQGLSRDMEELLVEGLLLQVSVPEVHSLYQVLLDQAHNQLSDRLMSQPEQTDCQTHAQFSSQENSLPSPLDVEAIVSEKKSKRHIERDSLNTDFRGSEKKHPLKRQKLNKKHTHRRPASTSSSPRSDGSQSENSGDETDVCPAERCQLPEGDEVNWVQCDGSCNQWFHQVCVGVTAETAEKEDYICVRCSISDV